MTAQAISKPRAIPGPPPQLLIGNIAEMRNGGALAAFERNFKKYGDLFQLKLGPSNIYVISSPVLAQEILIDRNKDFPKNDGILGLLLGNGLVTNNDHESWLVQRRMMQPMFHRQRLADMGEKMLAASTRLTARLETQLETQSNSSVQIDLAEEMFQVTLDIIMQVMFSADMLGQAGTIGPAISEALHFVQGRIQNPIRLPMNWPIPSHQNFHQAKHTLDQVVLEIIANRRASQNSGQAKPGDLLDMLLEARDADTGEAMSDAQLRDEVLTIFAAGHETTAHTLGFAFVALAQHPEVLARVQHELDTVLEGRAPTMNDLEHLPEIKRVLEETLRLYPAAPLVSPRVNVRDEQLAGFDLPKNSLLLISIFNIQRHPDFWPEPERFNPNRWLEPGEQHRLAYMPFGAGPRKCIGNNLALMEGQLILASVLQHYELHLEPGQSVIPEQAVTLQPKGGLKMILRKR
jgi:cytochrome P450